MDSVNYSGQMVEFIMEILLIINWMGQGFIIKLMGTSIRDVLRKINIMDLAY